MSDFVDRHPALFIWLIAAACLLAGPLIDGPY